MNEAGSLESSQIYSGAYCHRDSGLSLGADMLNQRRPGKKGMARDVEPALIERYCAALSCEWQYREMQTNKKFKS